MAGCYGNHPFDRHFESVLMKHLNEESEPEFYCEDCGYETNDDLEYNEEYHFVKCPECDSKVYY